MMRFVHTNLMGRIDPRALVASSTSKMKKLNPNIFRFCLSDPQAPGRAQAWAWPRARHKPRPGPGPDPSMGHALSGIMNIHGKCLWA